MIFEHLGYKFIVKSYLDKSIVKLLDDINWGHKIRHSPISNANLLYDAEQIIDEIERFNLINSEYPLNGTREKFKYKNYTFKFTKDSNYKCVLSAYIETSNTIRFWEFWKEPLIESKVWCKSYPYNFHSATNKELLRLADEIVCEIKRNEEIQINIIEQ